MGRRSAGRRVEEFILFDSLRGWEPHLQPQSTGLGTRWGSTETFPPRPISRPGPANCRDLRETPDSDQVADPRASPLRLAGAARCLTTSRKDPYPVQVFVRDNDVNGALRVLKKK